jgi:imidazolonepropionase-like amidohydrolase
MSIFRSSACVLLTLSSTARRSSGHLFRSAALACLCGSLLALSCGAVAADDDDPVATEEKPVAGEASEPTEPVKVIAITGGHLMTMSDAGVVTGGTILIRGKTIESVGTDVEIPEGATVIDATGMVITPGLIDLRSRLWMTNDAASDTGSTAALDAKDGVDPFDGAWHEVARQGITAVYVQPAARGSLGGFGELLRVGPSGGTIDQITIVDQAGLQGSLGVGTSNSSSKGRIAEFDALKKKLNEAKEYQKQWTTYREYEKAQAKKEAEAKKKADAKKKKADGEQDKSKESTESDAEKSDEASGQRNGQSSDPGQPGGGAGRPRGGSNATAAEDDPAEKETSDDKKTEGEGEKKPDQKEEKPPKKPEQDPLKDRLVRLLEGDIPLRMEVHRADETRRALELAAEFDLLMILEGMGDVGSAIESVQTGLPPIVLGPWLDAERENYQSDERIENWAEMFTGYEGRLAIATFSRAPAGSKNLRDHAAVAVAAGFDRDRVLEGLTLVPATLAGAGDQRGKLAKDYVADLALFAGDPLDPSAPVVMTMSGGEIVYQAADVNGQTIDGENALLSKSDLELPSQLPAKYGLRSQRILGVDGEFSPGLLIINQGLVVAIEAVDAATDSLTVYDLGQSVITPGLISAHAELILASLVDRQGLADSGPVRAADVYDVLAPEVRNLVAGGFLRVASVPGNDRVVAGQAAEIRLRAAAPIVQNELAEKVVLSDSARSRERYPSSLGGQLQVVRDIVSGDVEPSPLFLPEAALRLLDEARMERREAITSGERPVIVVVETDAEVAAGLKIIQELGFRGVIAAADQWGPAVSTISGTEIAAIVRPIRVNDFDWYAQDVAKLSRAGVPVAFSGEDPLAIRRTAAAVVQAGMDRKTALRALTVDAAAIVGMSEQAGRLTVGCPADLVIWSDSPLNLAAKPLAVLVDGSPVEKDK